MTLIRESLRSHLQDILHKTARKHLDLSKMLEDQDDEQWQTFVNEVSFPTISSFEGLNIGKALGFEN